MRIELAMLLSVVETAKIGGQVAEVAGRVNIAFAQSANPVLRGGSATLSSDCHKLLWHSRLGPIELLSFWPQTLIASGRY